MITSYDPRTRAPVGSIAESSNDAVDAAVQTAVDAAPALAALAPAVRREWLHQIAEVLEANRAELVRLADAETRLGQPRLEVELTRTCGQLHFYGDVAVEGSYLDVTIDEATDTAPRLVRVARPLGPVAVFGASNFPFAFSVLGNDTGSALAAGCPVVVKAHPAHVLLSNRLAEVALEGLRAAGAPAGTFAIVNGFQAGLDLVGHPEITAVAFTGSQAGGVALWRLANERERVIPVFAEMGTVNPVVVTPAAAARAAEVAVGFVESFTLGSGQFCTKPGLMLVPAGSGLARAVAEALGSAAPAPVMLTEQIAAGVHRGLAELQAAGATLLASTGGNGDGWSAPAAVLAAPIGALEPGSPLLEECFGPVAVVVEYAHAGELAAALDVLQPSLAASLVTGADDDPDAAATLEALGHKVGRVVVNGWPTGVAHSWAQHHGGPWPSTSAPSATSVGAAALARFVRPITYQGTPDHWLPTAARAENPWRLPRRVDGVPRLP